MARLTITLSDERHRALREAAVKRGKTIGQLIEESLDFYGIKTLRSAEQIVARESGGPMSIPQGFATIVTPSAPALSAWACAYEVRKS